MQCKSIFCTTDCCYLQYNLWDYSVAVAYVISKFMPLAKGVYNVQEEIKTKIFAGQWPLIPKGRLFFASNINCSNV